MASHYALVYDFPSLVSLRSWTEVRIVRVPGVLVLLIIVRLARYWVEVDWLVMWLVMVAMVAPLRPRTIGRWYPLSGLWLRSSNQSSP